MLKGLYIPAEILYNDQLNDCDMLTLSAIYNFNRLNNDFYMTAGGLSGLIPRSERAIKRSYKKLVDLKLIEEDSSKHYKSKCYKYILLDRCQDDSDKMTPHSDNVTQKGDNVDTKGCQDEPKKGDTMTPNKSIYKDIYKEKDKVYTLSTEYIERIQGFYQGKNFDVIGFNDQLKQYGYYDIDIDVVFMSDADLEYYIDKFEGLEDEASLLIYNTCIYEQIRRTDKRST